MGWIKRIFNSKTRRGHISIYHRKLYRTDAIIKSKRENAKDIHYIRVFMSKQIQKVNCNKYIINEEKGRAS
jgi:hypothetical protein